MSVLRDGPLEITGGGVKIAPPPTPNKKKILRRVISEKKIISEEATSIVFKVIKSMG